MDNICENNSTGTCRVVIGGTEFLGIKTGLENSIIKTMDRDLFLKESGMLWNNGEILPWDIETIYIHKNRIIPAGKWIEGETLSDRKLSFSDILNLARFFSKLNSQKIIPDSIYASGIYFSEDSSILIFPGAIMDLVISHQDEDFLIRFADSYKHPDLTGETSVCFFLGVCAYRTAAGEPPYQSPSLTEMREMMRKSRPVPPKFKASGLRENISDLIMESLTPHSGRAALDDWIRELEISEKDGFFSEISGRDADNLKKKADLLEKRRMKKFRKMQFVSKNGAKIAAAAAAVLAAALILYAPLKKAAEPPATAGLPPRKVVRMYYSSYNNLDVETMQDCITRSAGKKDINEVSGIFVISKVRKGYEGNSGIIQADKWLSTGKKELSGNKNIFGLTDIKIEKLDGTSFKTTYRKWITGYTETPADGEVKAVPKSIYVTDIVKLSKKRDAWIIDSLKRSERSD